ARRCAALRARGLGGKSLGAPRSGARFLGAVVGAAASLRSRIGGTGRSRPVYFAGRGRLEAAVVNNPQARLGRRGPSPPTACGAHDGRGPGPRPGPEAPRGARGSGGAW